MGSARGPSVLLVVEQLRRPVPGGIGTYARGLLSGLASLDASRLAAGRPPSVISLFASRARPDPLVSLGRPLRTAGWPSPVLTRAWDLGLARAPAGYDVVHGVSLATPGRRRRDPGPLVITVHDLAWRAHPEATTARGRRWHEGAIRRALERASDFVVPSTTVAGELVASGAPADTVHVIGEGSDHLPPPDRDTARGLLRAAGVEGPYLLSVSTLEPRKNLARLLAAYHVARPELPEPMPLVVTGPLGWGDPGMGGRDTAGVVTVGAVEGATLAGLYAGAAGFAYVPLVEGFGLPPLEAMAAGTPVVVSSTVPSVTEGPEPAPAIVVDPTRVEDIARAIVTVVSDSARSASLRAEGSAFAGARTWEAAASGHVSLWERLS